MNRQNKSQFDPSAIPKTSVSGYQQMSSLRVPQRFIEAMRLISGSSDTAAPKAPTKKDEYTDEASSVAKWKSSFLPLDKQRDPRQDKNTSSERTDLYDPSSPLSSDSEPEMPPSKEQKLSPPKQDKTRRHHVSPDTMCPDMRPPESSRSEPGSRPLDRREFPSGSRPTENRGLGQGHVVPERRDCNPEAGPRNHPVYDFASKALTLSSLAPSPSTQHFPVAYRGQTIDGEETITAPDYKKETFSPLKASPPRLKRDHAHQLGHEQAGLDQDQPFRKVPRNESKVIQMENCPITCDLCDIVLANAQELEDHLDSRSHWDTLEHIQHKNLYDDLAIAFLQEVMMYKSQHCSRAIEDSALQALQENDHMTKVGLFHCAACKVYISTSAAEVQTHITSQEHLRNTKEFEVQQRHSCLSKAETWIKELKPQFENFLKGGNLFDK